MKDKNVRRKNRPVGGTRTQTAPAGVAVAGARGRRGPRSKVAPTAQRPRHDVSKGTAAVHMPERAALHADAQRGARGLLHRLGLEGLYRELMLAVRVSIFIAGVWFNDYLIHRLFETNPPQVVMTMIPGLEWVMMWAILRETLSGSGITPSTRRHPTADAPAGAGKS